MILDNLSRAFRTQNWLAVATEFVIVIAGVVIGFQINAWNESRQARANIDQILALVLQDIETLQVFSNSFARYYDVTMVYGEAALQGWSDADALSDGAFIIAAYQASQITTDGTDPAVLSDVLGADVVRNIDDAALQQSLSRYFSRETAMQRQAEIDTPYRRNVRRAISYDMQQEIRASCGDIRGPGGNLELPSSCDVEFEPAAAQAAADALRARTDLRDDLRWHLASIQAVLFDLETQSDDRERLAVMIRMHLQ